MVIRVRKQDSAYLYQILESYEGLTNFSTLDAEKESPYRDIALHYAPDLFPELERLLLCLEAEIGLTRL